MHIARRKTLKNNVIAAHSTKTCTEKKMLMLQMQIAQKHVRKKSVKAQSVGR
jgi:hypothetical protein